jgi:hypothetical protein
MFLVQDGHMKAALWSGLLNFCASSKRRNQGIAKKLLEALRQNERGFGTLSSHPLLYWLFFVPLGADQKMST